MMNHLIRSLFYRIKRHCVILVPLMAACVPALPTVLPIPANTYSVPPAPHVVVEDSAFLQHFEAIRGRWINNTKLPDEETVVCLYGFVRNDTAFVEFIRPTVVMPMGPSVVLPQACAIPRPEMYGQMKYLGTAHNHSPDSLPFDGCYFSTPDELSFAEEKNAVIEVVICKRGLMWKGKPS